MSTAKKQPARQPNEADGRQIISPDELSPAGRERYEQLRKKLNLPAPKQPARRRPGGK